jgi:predicted enzyme related to lactoylglutathione lyase
MKIEKVGWFANVVDTEGNMFGIMESVVKDES